MYNTILVPLDGSKRAEAILSHVEGLAGKLGSKIILLTCIEPRLAYTGDLEVSAVVERDAEMVKQTQDAEKYLAEIRTKLEQQGIQATTTIMHGPPVEAIIEVAGKEKADLVAMASHGRGGLGRVFYGSVAAGTLHRVDRPLLIIRSQAS